MGVNSFSLKLQTVYYQDSKAYNVTVVTAISLFLEVQKTSNSPGNRLKIPWNHNN